VVWRGCLRPRAPCAASRAPLSGISCRGAPRGRAARGRARARRPGPPGRRAAQALCSPECARARPVPIARARRAALPTLDIAEGALDRVFEIYKRLLPGLGGYLTHAGELDQARLERLLAELGALELDVLQQRAEVRAGPGREGLMSC